MSQAVSDRLRGSAHLLRTFIGFLTTERSVVGAQYGRWRRPPRVSDGFQGVYPARSGSFINGEFLAYAVQQFFAEGELTAMFRGPPMANPC